MHSLLVARDCHSALTEPADADLSLKAHALITLHVEPHLLHLIDINANAATVWAAVERHFGGQQVVRLIELRREFTHLQLKDSESIADYFARAIELKEKFALTGEQLKDNEVRIQILAGLPPAYAPVVESIAFNELPIAQLMSRLQTTEQRLAREKGLQFPAAYVASGAAHSANSNVAARERAAAGSSRRSRTKCYYCGKLGHISRDCRARKAEEKEDAKAYSASAISTAVAL